jgi:DNA polymerase V
MPKQEVYALLDCNNFFVSCERAFQPHLQNQPVAVLSGNDGCVVSRSQEVKKLGLPMGAPYFKYADFINRNHIKIFSSNFELYSDMSNRVMSMLKEFTDFFEIYSIDEAFLRLTGVPHLEEYAKKIRKTVWQWTRIPVSIGIANTKTLAKAANYWAKHHADGGGVFSFVGKNAQLFLKQIPVEEIWGIGRQSAVFLNSKGIFTAAEFTSSDEGWVRKNMGVTGLRLVQELKNISCDNDTETPSPKKSIICSRSFGSPVTELKDLQQAVSMHAAHAAEKLRDEGEIAGTIGVYLRTNRHNNDKKYAASHFIEIQTPSQYTPDISACALQALRVIFKPGFRYKKVGVTCTHLLPEGSCQQSLFEKRNAAKEHKLMQTYDQLNKRFGNGTLQYAQSGITRAWNSRRDLLSHPFTTKIGHLPIVHAR